MDNFIKVDLKDGTGGFMIHNTDDGKAIANDLLKNKKYILTTDILEGETE